MEKTDDGLKALLEQGKEKGFLTYDQVNDHLPDDDTNPEKIDQILILFENMGLGLIDKSEAEGGKATGTPGAVDTLKRVHSGDLPFDRTVKVSLTENLEKDKILQRMPHNLKTLEHLMEQNGQDFEKLLDPRTPEEERRKLRRQLRIRRRKAVTLVEELSIRTQKVQPLMRKLEHISMRMDELEKQIEDLKGLRNAKDDRAALE